jgi:hypothetical protein
LAVDEDGATGVLSARRLVIRWNNAVNDGFDSPSFVAVKNCQEPGRSNSGAEDGKATMACGREWWMHESAMSFQRTRSRGN